METGPKISIAGHALILGLLVFGGPLFDSDRSEAIQISEVSIITGAEFDSMMSAAPSTPEITEPQPQVPASETDSVEAPEVESPVTPTEAPEPLTETAAEDVPDTPDTPEPPTPEAPVEAPEIADTNQVATGSAIVVPDAQVSNEDTPGQREPDELALLRPKPRPAPRVDQTPAPKPPTDADTASEQQDSTTPANETPTETVDQREETAPQESTTEIVTEPERQENTAAPVKSARPKGRPSDLVRRAQAAKEAAQAAKAAEAAAAEEARKVAEAKAIADALKAAQTDSAAPAGPPLTGSEKNALVLAVQECWNVPVGVQDAGNLVVVLSVELKPDGRLAGNPTLIEPAGTPQGLIKQAYEAGRRALLRCQPYKLPREKYEQWKALEVVFNPSRMVLR